MNQPLPDTHRPWPVVLLMALGAWMAALPLAVGLGLLLSDLLLRGPGPYLFGGALLALAAVVLRQRRVPIFVEQLMLPALLAGGFLLAHGLSNDLPAQAASAVLLGVALALAVTIDRAWLRPLLGATAAALFMAALLSGRVWQWFEPSLTAWWVLCTALLVWLGASAWSSRAAASHAWATIAEPTAVGWLMATLAGLCVFSGTSFMAPGAASGNLASDLAGAMSYEGARFWHMLPVRVLSVALAAWAVAWALRAWPTLRRPGFAGVGTVLAALAAWLPALGPVLLALAVTGTRQRWVQAGAATLAAAWVVGSAYYQLGWPLAAKAQVLAGAGAVLGLLAWLAHRGAAARSAQAATPATTATTPPPVHTARTGRVAPWLALAGAAATLLVVNAAIWQKERLIAEGQPLFVALAPVDPRSLMQGDYMRLNFRLPCGENRRCDAQVAPGARAYVVAVRDARGVATLKRLHSAGAALAAHEFLIELTPQNGQWMLVSDAWFFREGDAARWQQARFGEFRVTPSGQALLVGMADAQLQPIH